MQYREVGLRPIRPRLFATNGGARGRGDVRAGLRADRCKGSIRSRFLPCCGGRPRDGGCCGRGAAVRSAGGRVVRPTGRASARHLRLRARLTTGGPPGRERRRPGCAKACPPVISTVFQGRASAVHRKSRPWARGSSRSSGSVDPVRGRAPVRARRRSRPGRREAAQPRRGRVLPSRRTFPRGRARERARRRGRAGFGTRQLAARSQRGRRPRGRPEQAPPLRGGRCCTGQRSSAISCSMASVVIVSGAARSSSPNSRIASSDIARSRATARSCPNCQTLRPSGIGSISSWMKFTGATPDRRPRRR